MSTRGRSIGPPRAAAGPALPAGAARLIPLTVAAALVAISLAATSGRAAPTGVSGDALRVGGSSPAAEYSLAVTRICVGALLFEGTHEMGTRADALEIADAIRASTAGRLARIATLSVPPELQHTSGRWTSSQRRLAELYARSWVGIYDAIAAAGTPLQRATLARRLWKLVHAPDRLKSIARRLEVKLQVPDCTGGG
jgi:hypothetical protein